MYHYFNSTREIRVGDSVILRGTCCGRNLDGLRGQVMEVYDPLQSGYACGVRIPGITWGHGLHGTCPNDDGYMVAERNVMYAGDSSDDAEYNAPRCSYCYEPMTGKPSRLGSHLYKGVCICDKCIKRDIGAVHNYHFAKRLKYNIAPGKITLGAEIEIDGDDWECPDDDGLVTDCVKYAIDNKYALIMSYESDGSLNHGIECVTAPLTVNEWKSAEVRDQIDYLLDTARGCDFNFEKDNHAGLHVHIGRKDLCGDDKAVSDAVGLLMGWGATRLWDKGLRDLAGRGANNYCRPYWADDMDGADCEDDFDEYAGVGLDGTKARYNRYYFVNITNDKTLELRIFNRATCYEDVALAVDVCYMLGKWATKKINAFLKRGSYDAKAKVFTNALEYADRISWNALVKYSKFPEITLPRMRDAGINV